MIVVATGLVWIAAGSIGVPSSTRFHLPLRERREDIPLLIKHFVARAAAEAGRPILEIAADAMDCLLQYQWPGNIRELQNAVQHAVVLCHDSRITRADLPAKVSGAEATEFSPENAFARRPTLAQLEHDYIRFVLEHF